MRKKTTGIGLVIFDLAGTVVDYGSRAPARAFCELFARHGIAAGEAEARVPMGKHKRDHIAEMLAMPAIASQWRRRHGRDGNAGDVAALFEEFLPLQLEILPRYAEVIPGVVPAVDRLRRAGVGIAATTGYNREMTALVLERLAPQGLAFDFACCAAEVPAGRPAPWMIYRCMEAVGVFPPRAVLNVGDTIADVRAGANAGVWSVGVTMTGNMLGMALERARELSTGEAAALHEAAGRSLTEAGADAVVRSVADLPELVHSQF